MKLLLSLLLCINVYSKKSQVKNPSIYGLGKILSHHYETCKRLPLVEKNHLYSACDNQKLVSLRKSFKASYVEVHNEQLYILDRYGSSGFTFLRYNKLGRRNFSLFDSLDYLKTFCRDDKSKMCKGFLKGTLFQ